MTCRLLHSCVKAGNTVHNKGKVEAIAPNRIKRRFNTHIPHQKITTDTTEFKYYEVDVNGHITMHKLYLDPFMDMCNGEIVSFGIDNDYSPKM